MGISNVSNGLRSGVCTSSTRPTAPYEGQMIYETDTDMVALWNGSSWRYIASTTATNGTILQVVSATKNQTLTSSTSYVGTGLSVSVTPKSTSSKILVSSFMDVYTADITRTMNGRLVRNGTVLLNDYVFMANNSYNEVSNACLSFLDSPSSTSALAYSVDVKNSAAQTIAAPLSYGIITVMEIAG